MSFKFGIAFFSLTLSRINIRSRHIPPPRRLAITRRCFRRTTTTRRRMADSTAIFTFEDPFQGVIGTETNTENYLLCPSKHTVNEDQSAFNFNNHQSGHEMDDFLDTEDLLSDPIIWEVCGGVDDLTVDSRAVGLSGFLKEGHGMNLDSNPVVEDPPQQSCTCCQILREITHTNGINVKRLEIHGVFGIITHATLGIYDYGSSSQTQDCQMFDFHKESTQTVKNFLVQYYEVCRQEGYSPLQDPLSTFYEALSVGFNEPDNTNDFLQFPPENTGDDQHKQYDRMGDGSHHVGGGLMKIPLAMQRERTRKLGLNDFVDYFGLPIGDAARRLNICPTVMKKICRKHGVSRWPYRKIKSIERKISKSQMMLDTSAADEERARALEDIQKYKQQLANIYAEFTK